jgi:ElaB/YqjD/DUF883 family membrane-anchored ribosome-binding protein
MAKRQSTIAAVEHKIEDFAEDLGKMLGQARNKAEGWLGQREQIVKNLTQLRDEATQLLSQLGHDASEAARTIRRRGRPAGKAILKNVAKTRRTMSAKARAAISAAQKKRWAKVKADKK